jgi:hypothetical protein
LLSVPPRGELGARRHADLNPQGDIGASPSLGPADLDASGTSAGGIPTPPRRHGHSTRSGTPAGVPEQRLDRRSQHLDSGLQAGGMIGGG